MLLWSSERHRPLQNMPPVVNYGCVVVDNVFIPIMTRNLPALLIMTEMNICSCQKHNRCNANQLQLSQNMLTCTDMCKCFSCETGESQDVS